jgi:phosphoribosylanthranilate isomerase
MPTRVKICGITRAQDALLAVELGAAALGFNFYPPSPRYIEPSAARDIIAALPPLVMTVGVFADATRARHVAEVARRAGVHAVQLHGPRFPKTGADLAGFPLIRAVAVRPGMRLSHLRRLKARAFLLDAFDAQLRGGTGKTFAWSMARAAQRYGRIILAGGLTPSNVARAIRQARPFAVDVASGVESRPGKKDPARLRAFFASVRKADRDLERSIRRR